MSFFKDYFSRMKMAMTSVERSDLEEIATTLRRVRTDDGKVIIVGNGGSAAIAGHIATDLTKAAGIRAVSFADAGFITCFANDYGYEQWVAKALEAHANPATDMVILISSSGASPNIINAAEYCRSVDLELVTLSGFGSDNPLRKLGRTNLWVDSRAYNIIESTHQTWLMAVTDSIIGSVEYSA